MTSFAANQLTLIIIGRQWHVQGFGAKRVSRGGTRMTHADLLMALSVSLVLDPVLWPGTAVMCERDQRFSKVCNFGFCSSKPETEFTMAFKTLCGPCSNPITKSTARTTH